MRPVIQVDQVDHHRVNPVGRHGVSGADQRAPGADGAAANAGSYPAAVDVAGQRIQPAAHRTAHHRTRCRFAELGEVGDGHDAMRVQLLGRHCAHPQGVPALYWINGIASSSTATIRYCATCAPGSNPRSPMAASNDSSEPSIGRRLPRLHGRRRRPRHGSPLIPDHLQQHPSPPSPQRPNPKQAYLDSKICQLLDSRHVTASEIRRRCWTPRCG